MRSLVWTLVAAVLVTAIACGPMDGTGGGGGGGSGGSGGGTGGGTAGGGAGGGSAGGGAGGGSAGGGMGGGVGGGSGGAGNPRLVGITWNGNSTMDAGRYELRRIDPMTGASTLVGALPGIEGFYLGNAATADPARSRLYFVSYSSDAGTRLYTVDATNGAVLHNPALTGDYNWSGGLHLRPDGGLVGVTWAGPTDAGSEELRTLDPTTGATAKVASIPGMDWVQAGANASDPARDVAYAIASANVDPTSRLFSIRLSTGEVVTKPYVDTGTTGLMPFLLLPRANGTLRTLAAAWAGDAGTVSLADLPPATGVLSAVATIPADNFSYGNHAFDPGADRVYFLDQQNRLFTVDTATGAVVANPFLSPNDAGQPFYFGGGLFFVR